MTDPILSWLDLESRILKAARPVEVAFAAVNLAHGVVPYRQAALWSGSAGVVALSGRAVVDDGTPFVLWLNRVFAAVVADRTGPTRIGSADLPAGLAGQWADWLPAWALVLPMAGEALLFARDEPFSDPEVAVLERLADLVRIARRALVAGAPRRRLTAGRRGRLIAAALVVVGLFPVTGSVLAPAEAVPAHPVLVRAPLDGVVGSVRVRPNDAVIEGQVLFELDPTTLSGRLDVARQRQAIAEAEYRQAAQAMVFDSKAKAQVAILAGKAEEMAAEVRLLEGQLARIQARAPRAGIAVFDDPADWIGKPVAVGEKVMAVADETDTEIEAWAAVADIGEIASGGRVTVFLNARPLSPLRGQVRSVAYEAVARPDSTIAHRVRVTLDAAGERPRLGLKGTARIDGETVPLVWWLFRRPLSVVRQFVGF